MSLMGDWKDVEDPFPEPAPDPQCMLCGDSGMQDISTGGLGYDTCTCDVGKAIDAQRKNEPDPPQEARNEAVDRLALVAGVRREPGESDNSLKARTEMAIKGNPDGSQKLGPYRTSTRGSR